MRTKLIILKLKNVEKKLFENVPELSDFFSHFSEILLIEISSNPGTFFATVKIEFYMDF